jgi:hypothetical protein
LTTTLTIAELIGVVKSPLITTSYDPESAVLGPVSFKLLLEDPEITASSAKTMPFHLQAYVMPVVPETATDKAIEPVPEQAGAGADGCDEMTSKDSFSAARSKLQDGVVFRV